jgi:hypothetical protein
LQGETRASGCYARNVPRLAKSRQTAFDKLDRPCAVADIESRFVPHVRVALGDVSDACCASIARTATALGENHDRREIPTGHGAALVRHFKKRSRQLEPIKHPVEYCFALVELATLGCISGGWADSPLSLTTVKSHKTCIQQVAQQRATEQIEREQWRRVVEIMLNSPDHTADVFRSLACALVWCGYVSPGQCPATDDHLGQFFGAKREEFVRFRQEALRWLPWLLKFSLTSPAGGPP